VWLAVRLRWIFPRDPDFAARAGRILDLYQRLWEGIPLLPNDFVITRKDLNALLSKLSAKTLHAAA
jgi:hypothetical protein